MRYDNELGSLKRFEGQDHFECLFGYLTEEFPLRWGKYGASIKEYPFGKGFLYFIKRQNFSEIYSEGLIRYKYPKFCHGPCLTVSKSASEKIYEAALQYDWRKSKLEDVLFNGVLRELAGGMAQNSKTYFSRSITFLILN